MACKPLKAGLGGQPFPRSNTKTIHVDARLPRSLRNESGEVFSYKLTTVKKTGGRLVQHGTAPNYQGERITLCTCMHWHRTWPSIDVGTWVAGFSGNETDNELFYLMKVSKTATSFAELWYSGLLHDLEAKSACSDIYGDIYVPFSQHALREPHKSRYFREPIDNHKHKKHNEWHKDIDRWRPPNNKKRQRPALAPRIHKLLIGEPGLSFVWEHPKYRYKSGHPRMHMPRLEKFLDQLVPV